MATVEAPFRNRVELGEGPHWNPTRRRLTYVDINAGTIHDLDPATGHEMTTSLEPPVSFAVPVAGRTEVVCGTGDDLTVIDGGQVVMRCKVEQSRTGNRFNDGKADPAGRLWFGSMSLERTPGAAALYRLDADGLRLIDDVTTSNGLDWDTDRERMYYIDSPTQRIDVARYDAATGAIADRRPFVTIEPADGLPDGLTLDAEGCLWVALFQGGVVRRYDPDGALMAVVELPLSCPTCPVFGGDDLSTMFVTTSRHKLNSAERDAEPLAGALLVVDPGVGGRVAGEIAPDVLDALTTLADRERTS